MTAIRFTAEQGLALLARAQRLPKGRLLVQTNMPPAALRAIEEQLKSSGTVRTHLAKGRGKITTRSPLEVMLQEQIEGAGLPPAEYDKPYLIGTRHRLDVLWRPIRFGVEVQGMQHGIKGRFKADIAKRAIGLLQGWTVLEVDRTAIHNGKAIEWIQLLHKLYTEERS